MSAAERRGALPSALQAAPSLLARVDPQVLRAQGVSPATAVRDILLADFAWLWIGEADEVAFGGSKSRPRYQLYIYLFFLKKFLM